MNLPDDLKKTYIEASNSVLQAFKHNNNQPGSDATPAQLIEAINQFFIIYEQLDNMQNPNSLITKDNISQIGEQTMDCLAELSKWAERLDLNKEKYTLEDITLAIAHWVIRHHGEIRSLEAIVNIFAAKANRTSDNEILISLFHVMSDVIEHATSEFKNDLDKSDQARPWRMLNFNFAIVATRTMNRKLMVRAFDNLGRYMPEDCPDFFEEGLKQSRKPVYGPEIKEIMAEYFKMWTTLH